MSIAQPRRNQYSPTNQPTTKTEKRIGYEEGIHWSRRIFHMSNGVVAWILFDHGRNRVMFQKVVWCIRLHSNWVNELASRLFYPIMRKNETRRFSGMGYYLAGILFASYFESPIVFDIGIIHLAIGDPIAAIVGLLYSPHKRIRSSWWKSGKNVAGTFACWWICCLSTSSYLYYFQGMREWRNIWLLSSLSSCVSALVESWTPTPQYILFPFSIFPIGLDDNLLIPLFTCSAVHMLLRYNIPS